MDMMQLVRAAMGRVTATPPVVNQFQELCGSAYNRANALGMSVIEFTEEEKEGLKQLTDETCDCLACRMIRYLVNEILADSNLTLDKIGSYGADAEAFFMVYEAAQRVMKVKAIGYAHAHNLAKRMKNPALAEIIKMLGQVAQYSNANLATLLEEQCAEPPDDETVQVCMQDTVDAEEIYRNGSIMAG
jgi:hypothetical protein